MTQAKQSAITTISAVKLQLSIGQHQLSQWPPSQWSNKQAWHDYFCMPPPILLDLHWCPVITCVCHPFLGPLSVLTQGGHPMTTQFDNATSNGRQQIMGPTFVVRERFLILVPFWANKHTPIRSQSARCTIVPIGGNQNEIKDVKFVFAQRSPTTTRLARVTIVPMVEIKTNQFQDLWFETKERYLQQCPDHLTSIGTWRKRLQTECLDCARGDMLVPA